MKNWRYPVLLGINVLLCALNLGAGFLQVHNHHFIGSLTNFATGVFVAVMTVRFRRRWKQLDRAMAELHRHHRELLGRQNMSESAIVEAERKAMENLKLVAKAVGAHIEHPGRAYLKVGKATFRIDVGEVARMMDGTYDSATCYQMQTRSPYPEYIASVLLLLKHDPTIFDRWMKRDGYHV